MLPVKEETKDPLEIKFDSKNGLLADDEYVVEGCMVNCDLSMEPATNTTGRSADYMVNRGESDLEIHNFIDEKNTPYIVKEIDAKKYGDDENKDVIGTNKYEGEHSDIEEQPKSQAERVFIKQFSEKKPKVKRKRDQSQDESFNGIKGHAKDKPHECEICEKCFSTKTQLSRHMNSHTGNRPYKCQYCEASYGDPSTKTKHERTHTNERPYKCSLCDNTFAYSNVLKVHMTKHTGEKPHTCEYCGKNFSQLHHKKAHEKRHTSIKMVMYSPDIEYMVEEDDLKGYTIEEII